MRVNIKQFWGWWSRRHDASYPRWTLLDVLIDQLIGRIRCPGCNTYTYLDGNVDYGAGGFGVCMKCEEYGAVDVRLVIARLFGDWLWPPERLELVIAGVQKHNNFIRATGRPPSWFTLISGHRRRHTWYGREYWEAHVGGGRISGH